MDKKYLASLMCANYSCENELYQEMIELENCEISGYHLDIMDGLYVSNYALSMEEVSFVCKNTTKPIDIHLMVDTPIDYIVSLGDIRFSRIYVHTYNISDFCMISHLLAKSDSSIGLAINPDIEIDSLNDLIPLCSGILLMSVQPGYTNQKFLTKTYKKLKSLYSLKEKYGFDLILDGGVSISIMSELKNEEIDGYVLGMNSLFNKKRSYQCIMNEIRSI